jgi:hypothetical protein
LWHRGEAFSIVKLKKMLVSDVFSTSIATAANNGDVSRRIERGWLMQHKSNIE